MGRRDLVFLMGGTRSGEGRWGRVGSRWGGEGSGVGGAVDGIAGVEG